MTSAELEPIFDEILSLSQKKSYLKPVCNNILEDLVKQVRSFFLINYESIIAFPIGIYRSWNILLTFIVCIPFL